jgi:uncharacterized membrane protein YkoI
VPNQFRIGAAGCAAALLAAGCTEAPESITAAATAGPATSSNGAPGWLREPEVTAQEAQATALAAVGGGWILQTKIEERDDDPGDHDGDDDDFEAPVDVWEITVVSPDGLHRTVSVDLTGGKVLDSRVDDD